MLGRRQYGRSKCFPALAGGVRVIDVALSDLRCVDKPCVPCLLLIHKDMKAAGDVASHCPPLAGDMKDSTQFKKQGVSID